MGRTRRALHDCSVQRGRAWCLAARGPPTCLDTVGAAGRIAGVAAPGDSLLQRAGLIHKEQLAEAQRLRARSGGTVGEWLVRLGAVTEQQLVDFYHRRL